MKKIKSQPNPSLRFSPTAWAKLQYLHDARDTELGDFGIASAEDLLLIEDVVLVDQRCSVVEVELVDSVVTDAMLRLVPANR